MFSSECMSIDVNRTGWDACGCRCTNEGHPLEGKCIMNGVTLKVCAVKDYPVQCVCLSLARL